MCEQKEKPSENKRLAKKSLQRQAYYAFRYFNKAVAEGHEEAALMELREWVEYRLYLVEKVRRGKQSESSRRMMEMVAELGREFTLEDLAKIGRFQSSQPPARK